MSFFNDVLESIGSDKAPAPPLKPVKRLSSTDSNDLSKPVSKLGLSATATPQNGIKRKADDGPRLQAEKVIKPNPTLGLSTRVKMEPSSVSTNGRIRPESSQANQLKVLNSAAPGAPSTAPVKAPPKGSFADMMARAKAAQDLRGQNQVGMIKHQPVYKEKALKAAERKREDEERAKALKARLGPRPGSSGRIEKRRSASPTKKQDPNGISKQPKRPASNYKGTMKMASDRKKPSGPSSISREQSSRKGSRVDEYLGTDEEDNSDVEGDDVDDYGSDGSSDMEAGAFDIDEEETRALRAAKEDDKREHELEMTLKREKEERRRKLQTLANKRK